MLSFVALHSQYNYYVSYPTFLTGYEPGLCPAVFQYTIIGLSTATLSMAIAILWSAVAVIEHFMNNLLKVGNSHSQMVIWA